MYKRQVLTAEGILYRVVPGVSAALGATAYAGIPLTHRELAHSAILISGHGTEDHDANDWQDVYKRQVQSS